LSGFRIGFNSNPFREKAKGERVTAVVVLIIKLRIFFWKNSAVSVGFERRAVTVYAASC
jgi:hypothetical protein